jgi:hypothetical protein
MLRARESTFSAARSVTFAAAAIALLTSFSWFWPLPGAATDQPPARDSVKAHRANASAPLPAARRPDRPQVELITIKDSGFEPAELTRPQGDFLLAVTNDTYLPEPELHLHRVRGERLKALKMRGGAYHLNELLSLPPGEYALVEASRPDQVCRISITSR